MGGLTGANPYSVMGEVEEYDGTSWSEKSDLNTDRKHQCAAGGTSAPTATVLFGGENAASSGLGNTEAWNGTAWTEVADLSTARGAAGGPATSDANEGFYGAGRPNSTASEEWTQALNVKVLTD